MRFVFYRKSFAIFFAVSKTNIGVGISCVGQSDLLSSRWWNAQQQQQKYDFIFSLLMSVAFFFYLFIFRMFFQCPVHAWSFGRHRQWWWWWYVCTQLFRSSYSTNAMWICALWMDLLSLTNEFCFVPCNSGVTNAYIIGWETTFTFTSTTKSVWNG